MEKALVIAEKPSVAADIAKALGGFKKDKDIYERDDMVITSAVGHLLEMVVPDKYVIKKGRYNFKNLPHIPPKFSLAPISKSEQKLKTILKQLKRKDIKLLINACGAAREGELIFRNIVEYSKTKLEIKRLWLQSMTANAIREGFQTLKSDKELTPLSEAAKCRAEADWLVGINGTRSFTTFNNMDGGWFQTHVGRVQTPTLAMIVEREKKIKQHTPKTFYEILVLFNTKNGGYEGKYFDPKFKKNKINTDEKAERLWEKSEAEEIIKTISNYPIAFNDESKTSSQSPPQLFDLTSLQREANSRFGMSAKNTLGLAQALYEKHKVITYPRTDSKALPEDYVTTVKETIGKLKGIAEISRFCDDVLKLGLIENNGKVFNNKKVSDHFAIIPTGNISERLSVPEQKLFIAIVKRFLGVFFPAAKFLNTKRITSIQNFKFKTEGKVLVEPGWLRLFQGKNQGMDNVLVKLSENDEIKIEDINLVTSQTKPAPHFTEATLLSAMETAGKLVRDEDQREAMAEKGIGTPATRAKIIEDLIKNKYVIRDGRDLLTSQKAFLLMQLLKGLGIQELSRADLTGEWEFKLKEIENGRIKAEAFIKDIKATIVNFVEKTKSYTSDTIPGDYSTLNVPCPNCGGVVTETYKRYSCTNSDCDFSITKTPSGRFLTVSEAEEFIQTKSLGPIDGFLNRWGQPFASTIILNEKNKLEFSFQKENEVLDEEEIRNLEIIGKCPKCSESVVLFRTSYSCIDSLRESKKCDFRSGLTILQQTIAVDQMKKLLTNGKTDLLENFVSKKTKRKFKAFLIRQEDGKIAFEFFKKIVKKSNV